MNDERKALATSGRGALPDAATVNGLWQAEAAPRGGWKGLADRLLGGLLRPRLDAQRRFNAAQVQLDNALLRDLDERFAATHRLLAEQAQRQDEVDERHRLLEGELLRHVRDLVERIDLVLAEANREKLALAFALEQARHRLTKIEEALRRG